MGFIIDCGIGDAMFRAKRPRNNKFPPFPNFRSCLPGVHESINFLKSGKLTKNGAPDASNADILLLAIKDDFLFISVAKI